MPKQIPEEIKNTQQFRWAIEQDANSREASRFSTIFNGEDDFKSASNNVKNVLLIISREPNVNSHQFAYVIAKGGLQIPTRSKLVMEYNRHKRMFDNIIKLRQANKTLCDSILDGISVAEANQSTDKRAFVLDVLMQRVNP